MDLNFQSATSFDRFHLIITKLQMQKMYINLSCVTGKNLIYLLAIVSISRYQKYHNTLCLSSKISHRHCLQFLLGPLLAQRENKNNAYMVIRYKLWTLKYIGWNLPWSSETQILTLSYFYVTALYILHVCAI